MKKYLLAVMILFFAQSIVHAQNFSLIKDINTSKDASPFNYINDLYLRLDANFLVYFSNNNKYAILNGVAYFAADDGLHGTELWRSDGTAAGTYMVKDITAGSTSSEIQSITVAGSKIFFTATRIVYVSDGTEAGTVAVPGISYTADQTTCLTAVGNTLYFLTDLSRIWKTDGTLAGTSLVMDFRAIYNYSRDFLGQLTNVNGTLFFTTGYDAYNGTELWKSDGTLAGTVMVKDINPGTGDARPGNLTALNGKLYFTAYDGNIQLWSSDGTATGTQPVQNVPGATFSQAYMGPFTILKNILFFTESTSETGNELYRYDPANSAIGITLVKDISAGALGSNPANLISVGDKTIFFTAVNSSGVQELWKSNGTAPGTQLVKTLDAGDIIISNFTDAGGQLMFAYNTAANGTELWKSDGTVSGTVLVKDIYAGNHSSNISGITYMSNGSVLFNANNGVTGNELWRSNGTAGGTAIVKNINDITTANSYPDFYSSLAVNNTIYFSAYDPVYGKGLYSSDGTTAGTQLIKDINPGNSANPGDFALFKNMVYFSADSGGFNSVYKTDGTAAGTVKVFNNGKHHSTITQIVPASKYVYVFYYDADSSIIELWVSDGTAANSYKIQNVSSSYGAAIGNTLFFPNYDFEHGTELWRAGPQAGSGRMVKDIFPGPESSNIYSFRVLNNKLYFDATDGTNYGNAFLYVSDGTAGGTQKLYNVPVVFFNYSVIANGKLFFVCSDPVAGIEPYVSDGTTAGTGLLKDIYPGSGGSSPFGFTNAGNNVYFRANDVEHGTELWKSDGTSNGTVMVKDIYPGTLSSYPYSLTAAAGKLYFMALDISGAFNLYVSNGKPSGTTAVNDAGLAGVGISSIKGTNSKLFINGATYNFGSELYAGAIANAVPAANATENIVADTNNLKAFVMNNPVQNNLRLSVAVAKYQRIKITVADAGGRIFIGDDKVVNAGNNFIAYNTSAWASGIYFIKVTAANGDAVQLKVVK